MEKGCDCCCDCSLDIGCADGYICHRRYKCCGADSGCGCEENNPTTVELKTESGVRVSLDFYGENIVRIFRDNAGGMIRDPKAKPEAKILVSSPRKAVSKLDVKEAGNAYVITTAGMELSVDKKSGCMTAKNLANGKVAFEEAAPVEFKSGKVIITLKAAADEYFYGGGVQNGRFSHKGKVIAIENQNSWTDGGVASPSPNYWSTAGYGFMWHTFKKGKYDFGATEAGKVTLMHETDYLDVFFMVNEKPVDLLNDFYQLTGNPVLLPKFGFYEGHLNAYNRDYWKESQDAGGVLFEDGKRYRESQNDNGGVKESLNGEKNNYQFSARAVIDRYRKHDMPLGWILPNDGYGAGYGQTSTLDGNIQNLKEFGDYARKNGVEIGLWTESNLHPKEGVSALLQRDLIKEVRDAGVNALGFALPYSTADYEYVDVQFPEDDAFGIKKMENLTKNRLHTDGTTALYPTFVNLGEKAKINGSGVLFKIRMKAKRNVKFALKAADGVLVDKFMNSVNF